MTELHELQQWYAKQCDGDWEHQYGVTIGTVDNPGWQVVIDLRGTGLAEVIFNPISEGDDNQDPIESWLRCSVKGHIFTGAGDPFRLQQILRIFLDWARAC